MLLWPPNSQDLNPVEHLWHVLDQQIHGGPTLQLAGLKGSAANVLVPQDMFRGLVESIPRCIRAVFPAQRGTDTILGNQ